MSADGLPPLRDVIAQYGIAPKKALGQNFLLDLNLTGKIARAAGDLSGMTAVEIGAGPGGLTRALLSHGAARVIAIERDERAIGALAAIGEAYPGRLTIVEADALQFDFSSLSGIGPCRIVANLPYNIGTELLVRWLTIEPWPPFYKSMTLMFQREVAERIIAEPGGSAYGRLSVLAGWRCQARILFDVPAQAFSPPPKVTSAVVHLTPREAPASVELKRLERVTRLAFGQRRKMLRQSLKQIGGEALLSRAEIGPTRRPETLSIDEFVRLANVADLT